MKTQRMTQRVVKTLAPTDRGAIELARRYGDALVCVRHRTDHRGAIRHTTVELVVQSRPIQPRNLKLVGVRVEPHEREVHSVVKAAGGRWDSRKRIWQLPSRVVTILNLRDRVVDT